MQGKTNTSATDEVISLVERARQRDPEAFARLYDLYMEQIYRYLRYRLNNVADAEDLTQQAFIKAWQAIHRFQPRGVPFVAWLFRIAHNLVIDHHRKKGADMPTQESALVVDTSAGPEAQAERSETQAQLRRAILKLGPEQQQVIILRFIQGWDYPAVAAAMGKKEGTVRVLQYRALASLRHLLEGKV